MKQALFALELTRPRIGALLILAFFLFSQPSGAQTTGGDLGEPLENFGFEFVGLAQAPSCTVSVDSDQAYVPLTRADNHPNVYNLASIPRYLRISVDSTALGPNAYLSINIPNRLTEISDETRSIEAGAIEGRQPKAVSVTLKNGVGTGTMAAETNNVTEYNTVIVNHTEASEPLGTVNYDLDVWITFVVAKGHYDSVIPRDNEVFRANLTATCYQGS